LYYNHLLKRQKITVDPLVRTQLEKAPYFPESNLKIASVLNFVEHGEVLSEIIATRVQNRYPYPVLRHLKWIVIVLIEFTKAFLRLKLLWIGGGTILAYRTIPSRTPVGEDEREADTNQQTNHNGRFTRPTILSVFRAIEKTKELMRERDIRQPTETDLYIILGEILWITRPIIYLYLLYKEGKSSWWPWVISLLIDLASWRCIQTKKLNKVERNEISHRKLQIFMYLLRSPFFETVFASEKATSTTTKVVDSLHQIPGVSALMSIAMEFLKVYRNRYFYTAASK